MYMRRSIFKAKLIGTAALLVSAPLAALAQTAGIPTDTLSRPGLAAPALPDYRPAKKNLLPPPPAATPAPERPGGVGFVLRDVRLAGVTAAPTAELQAVARPWLGRTVDAGDLEDLRRALTEVYVRHGYVNSGFALPDQTVADGVVVMQAIEGRLTAVEAQGAPRLSPDYVARRLQRGVGTPLSIDELRESLEILLQDPVIERLDARLRPGLRPGEGVLGVTVAEKPLVDTALTLSNSRSPSVGSYEGRGDIILRNVAGLGDITSLRFARTRGLSDLAAAVEVPVTSADTRLRFSVEGTRSLVTERPFSVLDIQTDSTTVEFGVTQPVWRTASQNLTLGLTLARREVITRLLDERFSFSNESDNGRSGVTALRFSQNWTDRGVTQVVAARSTFSLGLDALDSTVKAGAPDSRFTSWLGQAQYARRLGDDGAQMLLRADVQLTNDPLPGIEQYAIGGMASVRGYRENLLVRDNAVVASVEFRQPVAHLALDDSADAATGGAAVGAVQAAVFADWGRGFNHDRDTPTPGSIGSVGVGVLWRPTAWSQLQAYYGRALRKVETGRDETTLEDRGVHFRLVLNP